MVINKNVKVVLKTPNQSNQRHTKARAKPIIKQVEVNEQPQEVQQQEAT